MARIEGVLLLRRNMATRPMVTHITIEALHIHPSPVTGAAIITADTTINSENKKMGDDVQMVFPEKKSSLKRVYFQCGIWIDVNGLQERSLDTKRTKKSLLGFQFGVL